MFRSCVFTCASVLFLASFVSEVSAVQGLTPGPVELQSIGPMTFASDGVLLVGDPKAATVYAIDMNSDAADASANGSSMPAIKDLKAAVASAISAPASEVTIGELAVDEDSQSIVISAQSRGRVSLLKVNHDGKVESINLDKIAHASKQLPNPPADEVTGEGRRRKNLRMESITDLAFFDGKVIVSGVSAGDSPSSVSEFPFPFSDNSVVTNVQIYHAAHGRVEEPTIRTFVPMMIDGEPTVLAGFTCTPLVRFPIDSLDGKETVRGTTVAELGNWNTPIDLIAYEKDGKSNLLMSNTARGLMKISTENIQNAAGLTERVDNGGTAGQSFQKIDNLDGVTQMDKLSASQAVAIVGKPEETQQLLVIDLP